MCLGIPGKVIEVRDDGGLKMGRVFVGNGPLLRVRANGELPGHTFRDDARR